MIGVTLICVGKLKEDYLRAACAEYQKRLGAFCKLAVVEIAEARLPERPSEAQIDAALAEEGARILAKIPAGCYAAALCIEGQKQSSEQLAASIASLAANGTSAFAYIIGGSFGLSDEVKAACRLRLSMSDMTFAHQLARVMLLEQVYRAFSINANTKYHK